jgi:hypothetical protein
MGCCCARKPNEAPAPWRAFRIGKEWSAVLLLRRKRVYSSFGHTYGQGEMGMPFNKAFGAGVLAAALMLPSAAWSAGALNVDARAYTCSQISQIIRQSKKVFVRSGFGGSSFRYPPAKCGLGYARTTANFRDKTGKQCALDYACTYDSGSFYNNP